MGLSSRQKSLLKRLAVVCDRTLNEQLPVKIEEIWGFGSFLRGKENPGDIDLVVRYNEFNLSFEAFKILTEGFVKIYGYSENRPETPIAALMLLVTELQKKNKNIIKDVDVFEQWLEGITWKMIFREMNPELFGFDWTVITKRRLLRRIKEIHIMEFQSLDGKGLLAVKEFELFWSRKNPDLNYHVNTILSPEKIRETCIKELSNFKIQLSKLLLELEVLRKVYKVLYGCKQDFKTFDECNDWLKSKVQDSLPQYPANVISEVIERWRPEKEKFGIIHDFNPDTFASVPLEELKGMVETKRTEVKEAQQELRILREVVASFKRRRIKNEWRQAIPIEVDAAWSALENVEKYLVKEERIRECLRKFGLPEHEIETVKHEGSRTWYRPFKS